MLTLLSIFVLLEIFITAILTLDFCFVLLRDLPFTGEHTTTSAYPSNGAVLIGAYTSFNMYDAKKLEPCPLFQINFTTTSAHPSNGAELIGADPSFNMYDAKKLEPRPLFQINGYA